MLADGRVVVTGGVDNKHTSVYDPAADGWVAAPPMHLGRGYQVCSVVYGNKTAVSHGEAGMSCIGVTLASTRSLTCEH